MTDRNRWWRPEWALTLLGLGAVVWFTLRISEKTSPGPLSAVHGAVKDLRGQDGCIACHGEGVAAHELVNACLECHKEIAEQATNGSGLHAKAPANGACGACHMEHRGKDGMLVEAVSFARLGIPDPKQYNHGDVDFRLTGAHLEAACEDCHANAHKLILPEGEFRFLGLQQTCTECHDDVHKGSMGSDCEQCHGQEADWAQVAIFAHTDEFPLEGGHAGLTCVQCHAPDGPHSVDQSMKLGSESVRSCAECHASPHREALLASLDQDCASCHSTEKTGFVRVAEATMRLQHSQTGFVLEGGHQALECSACHTAEGSFESRFLARQDCVDCHADPHGTGFDRGTLAQVVEGRTSCVRCHKSDASEWAPAPNFDHGVATGYALEGSHKSLDCVACHETSAERRVDKVRFAGQGDACARCHNDPHLSLFAAAPTTGALNALLGTPATDCSRCHGQDTFEKVDPFDHAQTGYALTGAHEKVECATCHKYDPTPEVHLARARPTGVVGVLDCTPCHTDPHGSRFDAVGMPQVVEDRVGCERCHVTQSFHDVDNAHFDHGVWTTFSLVGAHQQVRCSECHGANEDGNLLVSAFAAKGDVTNRHCALCHESPHGKVFQREKRLVLASGEEDCAQCHNDLSFRSTPDFDHADTGFALLAKHAQAQCIDCHNQPTQATLGRRLHPAPGTACSQCHQDPHLGQFGSAPNCADCHTGFESFLIPDFDHDQTGFPLDKTHAPLACNECHKPSATTTGLEAVRYKPLGKRCIDCHGQSRRGQGGDE